MQRSRGGLRRNGAEGITRVTVAGYKSLSQEQGIEIRPLTILAGANSSGKSSLMQPLLLMKQTLEASYDPGPLLLNGPNVKFTSVDQLLSVTAKGEKASVFSVSIETAKGDGCRLEFKRHRERGLDIVKQLAVDSAGKTSELRPEMADQEIRAQLPEELRDLAQHLPSVASQQIKGAAFRVDRNKCFLVVQLAGPDREAILAFGPGIAIQTIEPYVRGLIHLPGLRGNPARTYPVTAVGDEFPGTFEAYVASILIEWQRNDKAKLELLSRDLETLGLTWKVAVTSINDTQVEMQVGRLPHAARGGAWDLVNLADVGFGVSQTLPVLVALRASRRGQMVYLEQPEIHLHPRAQTALADVIAEAAKTGSRIVVETHSNLLLLGLQTAVREGRLSPESVKLHWFKRGPDGSTEIKSADLDREGRFGDWPVDFAEVTLDAEGRYLDANLTKS
jgi:predicted ATPase